MIKRIIKRILKAFFGTIGLLIVFVVLCLVAGLASEVISGGNIVPPSETIDFESEESRSEENTAEYETEQEDNQKQTSENPDEYNAILNALNNYENEVVLPGITGEKAGDLFLNVTREHPEVFWVSGSWKTRELTSLDGLSTTLIFTYLDSSEEIAKKKTDFDEKLAGIANEASKKSSDFDRVLFVHDYLVDNSRYDTETAASGNADSYGHTAYGCIVLGSGVCDSYSKAFMCILQKINIECMYVRGVANNGSGSENHAWNIAKLDGEYYQFDITWDDPVMSDGSDGKQYDYFGITTEEIKADHAFDNEAAYPVCTATDNNYFIHEGISKE